MTEQLDNLMEAGMRYAVALDTDDKIIAFAAFFDHADAREYAENCVYAVTGRIVVVEMV